MSYMDAQKYLNENRFENAYNILVKIANNKYDFKQNEANYSLGEMYLQGLYVKKDLDRAVECFKRADIIENQYLALLYYYGIFGIQKNYEEAWKYSHSTNKDILDPKEIMAKNILSKYIENLILYNNYWNNQFKKYRFVSKANIEDEKIRFEIINDNLKIFFNEYNSISILKDEKYGQIFSYILNNIKDIDFYFVLGILLFRDKRYNEAINYIQKCVENNHSFSKIILSYLYNEGLSVEKNSYKANEILNSMNTDRLSDILAINYKNDICKWIETN